jgi:hypothetical protein
LHKFVQFGSFSSKNIDIRSIFRVHRAARKTAISRFTVEAARLRWRANAASASACPFVDVAQGGRLAHLVPALADRDAGTVLRQPIRLPARLAENRPDLAAKQATEPLVARRFCVSPSFPAKVMLRGAR